MTRYTLADLHHDDGTHRSTPPTTDGHDIAVYQRALERHVSDGHTHEPDDPEGWDARSRYNAIVQQATRSERNR